MLYPNDDRLVNRGSRYRLGVGSFAYRYAVGVEGFPVSEPMKPLDFVQAANAIGAAGVQLCENLSYADCSQESLASVASYCERNGMYIELGMRDLTDENLERHICIAKDVGAKLIRVVLGRRSDRPERNTEELESRSVDVLRSAIPALKEHGLQVGIENHFDLRTNRLVRIVDKVDSDHVGFVFDTTNGIGFIERPDETLSSFLPRLLSVHIKDYRIFKVEAGYELRGCVLGEGWLDYRGMLEQVLSERPDSSIILELTVRRSADQKPEDVLYRESEMIDESFRELSKVVASIERKECAG
jgi:3-oxoisoapionate decarboxylase